MFLLKNYNVFKAVLCCMQLPDANAATCSYVQKDYSVPQAVLCCVKLLDANATKCLYKSKFPPLTWKIETEK